MWVHFKENAMMEGFKKTTEYTKLNSHEKSLVDALIEAQEAQENMEELEPTVYMKYHAILNSNTTLVDY